MGTEIFKIDAEIVEKIEVGVGTFTTEMITILCNLARDVNATSTLQHTCSCDCYRL